MLAIACSGSPRSIDPPRTVEAPTTKPAATTAPTTAATPDVQIEPTVASDALVDELARLGLLHDAEAERAPWTAEQVEVLVPRLAAVHAECLAGSRLACWLYDDTYAFAVVSVRRIGEPARTALAPRCEGSEMVACAVVAESIDDPRGVGGHPIRAVEGLVRACRAGLSDACVRAASIRIGSGIEMGALSAEEAESFLEPACKRGVADACWMIHASLGAYDPDAWEGSVHHRALARVCACGDESACRSLVDHLTPQPFGCELCDFDAAQSGTTRSGTWDERCIHCAIAACRKAQCCEGCPGRTTHACCADEPGEVLEFPERVPAIPKAQAERLVAAAREGTAAARVLAQAGCDHGVPRLCFVDALDGRLADHARTLDAMTRP